MQQQSNLLNFFSQSKNVQSHKETKPNTISMIPMIPITMQCPPEGLCLVENFITPAEEAELVAIINKQEWDTRLKRRTQHYGFR